MLSLCSGTEVLADLNTGWGSLTHHIRLLEAAGSSTSGSRLPTHAVLDTTLGGAILTELRVCDIACLFPKLCDLKVNALWGSTLFTAKQLTLWHRNFLICFGGYTQQCSDPGSWYCAQGSLLEGLRDHMWSQRSNLSWPGTRKVLCPLCYVYSWTRVISMKHCPGEPKMIPKMTYICE